MEQRIELFKGGGKGKSPTAMENAKATSERLAKKGWFVHDTCAWGYLIRAADDRVYLTDETRQEVMVTYRRKA